MIVYAYKMPSPPPPSPTHLFDMGRRPNSINHSFVRCPEVTALCDDTRFSQKCQECPNPKRLVITNKDRIPLTNVFLPPQSSVTVGFNDANCACECPGW